MLFMYNNILLYIYIDVYIHITHGGLILSSFVLDILYKLLWYILFIQIYHIQMIIYILVNYMYIPISRFNILIMIYKHYI